MLIPSLPGFVVGSRIQLPPQGVLWSATTDYDHARPGFLMFVDARLTITAPSTVRVYIRRESGYQGAVSALVSVLSTTGVTGMTAGVHIQELSSVVSFEDQEAGVKYVDIDVTSAPGVGFYQSIVTLSSATGGAILRNPEMHIHLDDGDVNPGATIITGGADFSTAMNSASGGDLILLRSGTDYAKNTRPSGQNVGGFWLTNSGSQSARITLASYPEETAIIDQQYAGTHDGAGYNYAAALILNASYLTVKGLEIRNMKNVAIEGTDTTRNVNAVYDCHIHDLANPDPVPGGHNWDNVGAIRCDHSIGMMVHNNLLHDIYDPNSSSNPINAVPLGLHSGIHGFWTSGMWIQQNTIHTTGRGVFLKQPNDDKNYNHRVDHNFFYDLANASFEVAVAGAGAIAGDEHMFHHNVSVIPAATPMVAIRQNETVDAAKHMQVFNNTLVGGVNYVSSRQITDVVTYNNLVVDTAYPGRQHGEEDTSTRDNWAYSDYNCFDSLTSMQWQFARFGADETLVTGLTNVRNAHTGFSYLQRQIELNSFEDTAVFVDAGSDDYRTLSGPTVGSGRFGQDIGIGSELVGVQ